MKETIIKFDFKIGARLNGYITIYTDYKGMQLLEMIDEEGKLIVDENRHFDINDSRQILKFNYTGDPIEKFAIIRDEFDNQANAFLEKVKFLRKKNFLIRCQKDDILTTLEAEALNDGIPFARAVRNAIKDSFKYDAIYSRLKDLAQHYSPYMLMSYKETIKHEKFDPFTFIVEGESLYTLIIFITQNPMRWEYKNGFIYVPEYKFREQAAPYQFSFNMLDGYICENPRYLETPEDSFIRHLESKNVISYVEEYNYSHPLMSHFPKHNTVQIDLSALKTLVNRQIKDISMLPEETTNGTRVNKNFLFLADAKQKGYSHEIPLFFESHGYEPISKNLDAYVDANFNKWENQ